MYFAITLWWSLCTVMCVTALCVNRRVQLTWLKCRCCQDHALQGLSLGRASLPGLSHVSVTIAAVPYWPATESQRRLRWRCACCDDMPWATVRMLWIHSEFILMGCIRWSCMWPSHDVHVTITWHECDHHTIGMWPSHDVHVTRVTCIVVCCLTCCRRKLGLWVLVCRKLKTSTSCKCTPVRLGTVAVFSRWI